MLSFRKNHNIFFNFICNLLLNFRYNFDFYIGWSESIGKWNQLFQKIYRAVMELYGFLHQDIFLGKYFFMFESFEFIDSIQCEKRYSIFDYLFLYIICLSVVVKYCSVFWNCFLVKYNHFFHSNMNIFLIQKKINTIVFHSFT